MDRMNDIQLGRAHALAAAHGHEWGDVPLDAILALPERTAAQIAGLTARLREECEECEAIMGEECGGAWGGIAAPTLDGCGNVVHTTASGRLRWTVAVDGWTILEVTRPSRVVRALRALAWGERGDEQAREALALLGRADVQPWIVEDVVARVELDAYGWFHAGEEDADGEYRSWMTENFHARHAWALGVALGALGATQAFINHVEGCAVPDPDEPAATTDAGEARGPTSGFR